jgi:hypothetical protein
MIVQDDDEQPMAWPIVGAMGKSDRQLVFAAHRIAELTGLPWAVIDQGDSVIFSPFYSIRTGLARVKRILRHGP